MNFLRKSHNSNVGYLNGTTFKVNIEYYNKSDGGKANLVFEYSIDKGVTWQTVPSDWLHHKDGERTVSIIGNDAAVGIDYVAKLAKANKELENYGNQVIYDLVCDIAGDSINNFVSVYHANSTIFSKINQTNWQKLARFWEERTGKKLAKAVYQGVFKVECGLSDEEEIWTEIKNQLQKEFEIRFDFSSFYNGTNTVIDSIGTIQAMYNALAESPKSEANITGMEQSILDNIREHTVGQYANLDGSQATAEAGFSGIFSLAGTAREAITDQILKLDPNLKLVWKFATKATSLVDMMNGIDGSGADDINRAKLSLAFAENGNSLDFYEASLALANTDGGNTFWLFHEVDGRPRKFANRTEFENVLNGQQNKVINALVAQMQGVDLPSLIYKDLLKVTLDTTRDYYKMLLS